MCILVCICNAAIDTYMPIKGIVYVSIVLGSKNDPVFVSLKSKFIQLLCS